MSKPLESSILPCECGTDRWTTTYQLRWKEGTGVTSTPAGHKCAACGMEVDNAWLIKREQLRLKRQEAAAALAEVQEMEGTTKPGKVNLNVRV